MGYIHYIKFISFLSNPIVFLNQHILLDHFKIDFLIFACDYFECTALRQELSVLIRQTSMERFYHEMNPIFEPTWTVFVELNKEYIYCLQRKFFRNTVQNQKTL